MPYQLTTTAQLSGQVFRPHEIGADQRGRMAELLNQFFENVTREQFEQDLLEKEWVFVFTDAAGMIQGFSTLMRINLMVDGQPVVAVYSGDTIIHPDYWHEMELPKLWGNHVFALADIIHTEKPNAKIYWFLISSGYKTYRFLPVFFETFYPNYRQPTPPQVQRILDAFACYKFGDQYDPQSGIIRFHSSSPLREGVAEVDERRLKNPDIAFFVERNPGHAQGDQLACLVEIDSRNITAAGRRMLAG
ncbi:MAG: hypothetical protein KF893_01405 [Caldilineaceae bacterium]|nr:hypothetical protein [Caldilineaceae bacterium]